MGSLVTNWNFHILWDGTMMNLGLSIRDYIIILAGVIVMFTVSLIQERSDCGFREKLQQKPMVLRHALVFLLLVVVLLLGNYGIGYDAGNFIYNRF